MGLLIFSLFHKISTEILLFICRTAGKTCSDANNATLKMCQQQNTGSLFADKPSLNATPCLQIGPLTNRGQEMAYCGYVNFKNYLTTLSTAETIKRQ
jgi:hypothetical protein